MSNAPPPPPTDEIVAADARDILGLNHAEQLRRLIKAGRITPSRRLPRTGVYLFWRHDVERLARELAVA